MTLPVVSVVMPVHNSSKFVRGSIESVINQTFRDWELILVDDCSDDDSLKIIERFARSDHRIKVIALSKNSGAAVARNTAIEAARGRYIAFLDSDDLWFPEKLSKQLLFMNEKQASFSFSAYEVIDESGAFVREIGVPGEVTYSDLLKTCVIGCLTVIYDTKVHGKVYMPLIRKRQDFGLWLRLLQDGTVAHGLNCPLAQYRERQGSISSNKAWAALYNWRIYREVEGLSLPKALYYFSQYAVRGVLRRKFPSFAKRVGVLHEVGKC